MGFLGFFYFMFWQASFNYAKFSKMDRDIQEGMQELSLSSAIYLEILMFSFHGPHKKGNQQPNFQKPRSNYSSVSLLHKCFPLFF